MQVYSSKLRIVTKGFSDTHDITKSVRSAVAASSLKNGVVTVIVPGSTAGITTIEFESGVIQDLKQAIERLVPQNIHYAHDAHWGDGNGFAHVRAALLGPSVSIPFVQGELCLGTWQQIILIDFDNRSRNREVIIQVLGN